MVDFADMNADQEMDAAGWTPAQKLALMQQRQPQQAPAPQGGMKVDPATGRQVFVPAPKTVPGSNYTGSFSDYLKQVGDRPQPQQTPQVPSTMSPQLFAQMYSKKYPDKSEADVLAVVEKAKNAGMFGNLTGGGSGGFMGQEYNRLVNSINPDTGRPYTDQEAMQKLQSFKRTTIDEVGGKETAKKTADVAAAGGLSANTELGKDSIKYAQKINDDADAASTQKMYLSQVRNLTKDFTPGKLAPLKQFLGAWAVGLGMDQEQADQTFGSAGSMQALTKTVIPMVTSAVRALSSRPTQMEWSAFLKANPNIEMTPDGLEKVTAFAEKVADLAIEKQDDFMDWKTGEKPESYANFSQVWNKKMAEKHIRDSLSSMKEEPPAAAEVQVINPQGQPGTIPADKLDAALKAGYKKAGQ